MVVEAAAKILEESLGQRVLIKLRGKRRLRGKLEGFDQHLNLVLKTHTQYALLQAKFGLRCYHMFHPQFRHPLTQNNHRTEYRTDPVL